MTVDVKPVLVIAGEVIEVSGKSFTNRETGEVTDKGRVAIVKTAKGFIELKLPVSQGAVAIAAGDRGAWFVQPFDWGMIVAGSNPARERHGVAFVYEAALPDSVFAAIADALEPVAV